MDKNTKRIEELEDKAMRKWFEKNGPDDYEYMEYYLTPKEYKEWEKLRDFE